MESRFVINIGRQLGSGGRVVGEIIARRLGVSLYDRELLELAARRSGLCAEVFEQTDEMRRKTMLSTLLGYLRSPLAGDDGGMTDVLSADALFRIQSDVIRELAAAGPCIFVGRCADYILRDDPRAVNVFITADDADRVRRIRQRHACSEAEARARMERGDAARAGYYNYYSSRTWGEAATYHLCVNSSSLGDEGTADLILAFAARKLNLKF